MVFIIVHFLQLLELIISFNSVIDNEKKDPMTSYLAEVFDVYFIIFIFHLLNLFEKKMFI